jgi:predicted transcriptional regulator
MATNSAQQFSELTAEIVSAYVGNNALSREELASLIINVHDALLKASKPPEPEPAPQDPAVPIRSSVKPDFIVCLEDGRRFKSLKRHLNSDHGMTPDEYRAKWSLKRDYPMVAPSYAATRSHLAKSIGFGRKEPRASADDTDTKAPRQRKRSKAKS